MNKRGSGSPKRDKRGRWKKGVSGNPHHPVSSDPDLNRALALSVDRNRLVRSILQSAYSGDARALDQVIRAIQSQQSEQPSGLSPGTEEWLNSLSLPELKCHRAMTRPSDPPSERGRAVLECAAHYLAPTLGGTTVHYVISEFLRFLDDREEYEASQLVDEEVPDEEPNEPVPEQAPPVNGTQININRRRSVSNEANS